jgi:AAA domain-containing protein
MTAPTQTTLINLWGGPGSGKSTTAADVFARMKLAGKSIELVREYVKTWAWRGDKIGPFDDVYITAKQLRNESALYGKVEYIVTDSPLSLGQLYERLYNPNQTTMANLAASLRARQAAAGIRVIDCLVKRTKPYVAAGRWEDEAAARRIDGFATELLQAIAPQYHVVHDAADVLRVTGVAI